LNAITAQVHALATRYGWKEADILRLPLHRRNAYIELINEDIRRESGR